MTSPDRPNSANGYYRTDPLLGLEELYDSSANACYRAIFAGLSFLCFSKTVLPQQSINLFCRP
jgi:hypothetical protein